MNHMLSLGLLFQSNGVERRSIVARAARPRGPGWVRSGAARIFILSGILLLLLRLCTATASLTFEKRRRRCGGARSALVGTHDCIFCISERVTVGDGNWQSWTHVRRMISGCVYMNEVNKSHTEDLVQSSSLERGSVDVLGACDASWSVCTTAHQDFVSTPLRCSPATYPDKPDKAHANLHKHSLCRLQTKCCLVRQDSWLNQNLQCPAAVVCGELQNDCDESLP